jgi:hypothetical protein
LKCDGTRAETRFRLSAKRTSPFKLAGASVQSTTDSRVVRISGSNAGYTMFRASVKGTGYPLHSPVSPSLPLPCVTMCHHISTGVYSSTLSFAALQVAYMNGKLTRRAESQQFQHICIPLQIKKGKFTLQRAMKVYRGNRGITTLSLTSAPDRGGWFSLRTHRFNPLNAGLNPICHLLALLGVHHILHVSRLRVNRGNDRPRNHCVGARAGMDGCEKSRRYRDWISGSSSP